MSLTPVFWAIALALVALCLAALLWPLLRRRAAAAPSEDAARAAVYRDQKRQLDDDLSSGAITPGEHEASLAELTRRLGGELDRGNAPAVATASERPRFVAALVAVAVVPVAAVVMYLALGAPEAMRETPASRDRPTDQQVIAMVESLAQKMKANPGDPKGWRLLGRSYAALGRFGDSASAFGQAVQHGADDADVYADWAEALALAQNSMTGEPEDLAQKALGKDAGNVKALALLATAAYERKDYDKAIALWQRVQAALPPGSEDAAQAGAAIAEIERARGSAAPNAAAGSAAASGGQGAPSSAPTAGSVPVTPGAGTPDAAAGARDAAIAGRVEVAPALAARIAPGDTLFVFARAASGPRMPLAILRRKAADLPLDFRLDDSMGMGAGPALSAAPAVIVEARVSKSGQATPQPGDLAGRSGEVHPGATGVQVVIDQLVQ